MTVADFFYQILLGVVTTVLIAIGGSAPHLITYLKKRRRKMRMTSFFGEKADRTVISLPVFHPLTTDDFDDSIPITRVKKFFLEETNQPLVEKDNIPMFSDTIVVDDYYAYRTIVDLFIANDMDEVRFKPDEKLVEDSDWLENPCLVAIGGPRSNQKLAEVMFHFPPEWRIVDLIHPPGGTLDEWILTTIPNGNSLNFGVTEDKALGVIFRLQNPQDPDNYFIALFGDRGESTLEVCRFLKNNIDELIKIVKDNPFVAVVSITGHSFSISELMYVATFDKVLFQDKSKMSKFLK